MKKKIGLLTYFWSGNYGTFLQCYCMLEALKQRFSSARVELINFRYPGVVAANYRSGFKRQGAYHLIRNALATYRRRRKCERNAHLLEPKSGSLWSLFDYEDFMAYLASLDYDLIVVGSDTIFQMPSVLNNKCQRPISWLSPQLQSKKVACAASSGTLVADELDERSREFLRSSLDGFDMLGVRDDATYSLFSEIAPTTRERLEMVPDPTFNFAVDHSLFEAYCEKNGISLEKPTMGIDLPQTVSICKELIEYFRSKGFQIVSPRFNKYVDHVLSLSQFEWAGMHRFCSLYITCHFHGTVFSLKNRVPVLAIDYMHDLTRDNSKMYCILNQYGLAHTHHVNLSQIGHTEEVARKADIAMESWDRGKVSRLNNKFERLFKDFVQKIEV